MYKVGLALILVKLAGSLKGIHQPYEVIGAPCQRLLRVDSLGFGYLYGLVEDMNELFGKANVIDGLFDAEKIGLDSFVHVAALEAYPIAFPALFRVGTVRVPFARKQ